METSLLVGLGREVDKMKLRKGWLLLMTGIFTCFLMACSGVDQEFYESLQSENESLQI